MSDDDPEDGKLSLHEANAKAEDALARDADVHVLQRAALHLGVALRGAADDGDLWSRLAAGQDREQLNDEQRVHLRAVLGMDWAWMLESAGYEPRDTIEIEARALTRATEEALDTPTPANSDAVREKLYILAERLTQLGSVPSAEVKKRRLRRWLRTGVRVGGKVAILASVAAGTIALGPAAPAALIAHGIASHVAAAIVEDLMKDGASRALEKVLARILGEESASEEESIERIAVTSLLSILPEELTGLMTDWELAGSSVGESREKLQAFCERTNLLARTRHLLERAMTAVHLTWEASLRARWSSNRIRDLLDQVEDLLIDARKLLHEGLERAHELSDLLRRLAPSLSALQIEVGTSTAHGH